MKVINRTDQVISDDKIQDYLESKGFSRNINHPALEGFKLVIDKDIYSWKLYDQYDNRVRYAS